MHVALFFVGMALGCMAGVLIGCLAAAAARGNAPLRDLDNWKPSICTARPGGVACMRLALPGTTACREHSINPVTRNSV